ALPWSIKLPALSNTRSPSVVTPPTVPLITGFTNAAPGTNTVPALPLLVASVAVVVLFTLEDPVGVTVAEEPIAELAAELLVLLPEREPLTELLDVLLEAVVPFAVV